MSHYISKSLSSYDHSLRCSDNRHANSNGTNTTHFQARSEIKICTTQKNGNSNQSTKDHKKYPQRHSQDKHIRPQNQPIQPVENQPRRSKQYRPTKVAFNNAALLFNDNDNDY